MDPEKVDQKIRGLQGLSFFKIRLFIIIIIVIPKSVYVSLEKKKMEERVGVRYSVTTGRCRRENKLKFI